MAKSSSNNKQLQIRNSTAEFLIFTKQAGENTIEVMIEAETVWLSQKLIALLFQVEINTINYHIKEIFKTNELQNEATTRNFRIVQTEGKRQVERDVEFYNLDIIIAIGYRVNSQRAIQFRQWATGIIRDFAIKGYVLDKERLKNGAFFSKTYFDDLLAEIREIRTSERNFYQKITDIYTTALDYNKDAVEKKHFLLRYKTNCIMLHMGKQQPK
jgi:hypothetical protein